MRIFRVLLQIFTVFCFGLVRHNMWYEVNEWAIWLLFQGAFVYFLFAFSSLIWDCNPQAKRYRRMYKLEDKYHLPKNYEEHYE